MKYTQTSHDIEISVEVDYIADHLRPKTSHIYLWAYRIGMLNKGSKTVHLKTRHWDILDGLGRLQCVDGEGVVGQTPSLSPNELFSYSSTCPLQTTSGTMSGYYTFETEQGIDLKVIIPCFSLDLPNSKPSLN